MSLDKSVVWFCWPAHGQGDFFLCLSSLGGKTCISCFFLVFFLAATLR